VPERVEVPNKTTQLLNLNKRGEKTTQLLNLNKRGDKYGHMGIQLLASILVLGGENSPR